MKPSKQRELRIDSLLHSCPVLCTELGLQGLARLATTSSGLRNVCQSILFLGPASWIASALSEHGQAQRMQAAEWVLQAAPAAAADVAEVLIHAPAVTLNTAKRFVAAGTRVTHAQLLAAANSMVAGVEVWVQAQKELGIQTDIPAAAEAICCSVIRDIYTSWVSLCLLPLHDGTCLQRNTLSRHVTALVHDALMPHSSMSSRQCTAPG
jgi:hypothetical protein